MDSFVYDIQAWRREIAEHAGAERRRHAAIEQSPNPMQDVDDEDALDLMTPARRRAAWKAWKDDVELLSGFKR